MDFLKTLLVAGDEAQLEELDFQIRTLWLESTACADAETALAVYRQIFHPLVVVGTKLPDMDGLELCRRIRRLPQGECSMILVINESDMLDDVQAAFEAGADECLMKPVRPEHFQKRLSSLVKRFNHKI